MISQPPLIVVHDPLEVWDCKVTIRPFVVKHRIARDARHAEAIVRFRSENATKRKTK